MEAALEVTTGVPQAIDSTGGQPKPSYQEGNNKQSTAQYSSGMLHPEMAPYWMIMLWALFATTLNVSMYWVKQLYTLWISVLGAVLAPLTYYAGERLGAVAFTNPVYALGVISLGWAVLFPVLVYFARNFNGFESDLQKSLALTWNPGRSSANV